MSVNLGIVGCGFISDIYLSNLRLLAGVKVVALTDLDMERAQRQAHAYEIAKVLPLNELLTAPEIDVVLNLTIPKAHAQVSLAALEAGKSVYNEKPLAIQREDAEKMLKLAREKALRIGCAPDTFLGAGLQTCRQLIDAG
ncbi:MAG TPA: Gfo/Idh/MocA family oxidoreductase, partial [Terrimicrobiaceae bacterium]